MDQYSVTLTGVTPLLLHADNLAFSEKVKAWQKDPANRELSHAGDDRSPAWTWIGSAYHDGRVVGIDSDNIMTMLREGGAKVKTGKGKDTYKKQTQSGLMLDQALWPIATSIYPGGVPVAKLNALIGVNDFSEHLEIAEMCGFELLVKRARIGMAKNIRVRPMFRAWTAAGSITVMDSELSGLTQPILQTILTQAGIMCGLGDWRPSSNKSGTFGKFMAIVEKL